ncbi:MAG: tol-pal system protein YbgF [Burkholderiales bacterium]
MNMQISNIGKASWMLLLAGSMLGGAWAADTPATAPQTSRDTLASELHGRIRALETWRAAMLDATAMLETRYSGVSQLQSEIRNSLVAMRTDQTDLKANWSRLQARHEEVAGQIAQVISDVTILAQVQQKTDAAVVRAEKQSADRSGVIQLMNQVDALNLDLNRLRGQIEVLNNGIENAQKRQRDMYVDLDTRLRRMEGQVSAAKKDQEAIAALEERIRQLEQGLASARAVPAVAAAPAATEPSAPVPVPPAVSTSPSTAGTSGADQAAIQRSYDGALSSFRNGDYQGAIKAFDVFLKGHPKHALAPNAQYWIGECHFQLRDYRGAIDAHRRLLGSYPESSKSADALLIIGSAETNLGDNAAARKTLEELVAKYPGSESAEKAKSRLAKLK